MGTQTFSSPSGTAPPATSANSQVISVEAPALPTPFKAGRFALQIDTEPPQSFITSFDITGGWPEGTLNIYNPLGMQMARLEWTAQSARLLQGRQVRESASLERLVFELTGTQLPTAAVIDWLAGKPTPAEGWNVDVRAQCFELPLNHDVFAPGLGASQTQSVFAHYWPQSRWLPPAAIGVHAH
jgi:outer membrane lipoprotein LolB